jgi:hypothetical protein
VRTPGRTAGPPVDAHMVDLNAALREEDPRRLGRKDRSASTSGPPSDDLGQEAVSRDRKSPEADTGSQLNSVERSRNPLVTMR